MRMKRKLTTDALQGQVRGVVQHVDRFLSDMSGQVRHQLATVVVEHVRQLVEVAAVEQRVDVPPRHLPHPP